MAFVASIPLSGKGMVVDTDTVKYRYERLNRSQMRSYDRVFISISSHVPTEELGRH
jgi:hypothetical protein